MESTGSTPFGTFRCSPIQDGKADDFSADLHRPILDPDFTSECIFANTYAEQQVQLLLLAPAATLVRRGSSQLAALSVLTGCEAVDCQ